MTRVGGAEVVPVPHGPVEVLVVAFPGSRFSGDIAPALTELVERGDIRIIDMVVLTKTAAGAARALEVADAGDADLAALDPIVGGLSPLLNEDDVATVAEQLDPGSSAGILVVEHVWASRLAQAVRDSAGEMVFSERIPAAVVEAAYAAAESA